jgi:glycine/D-amino acid oxidase-like deaminating enzyme
MLVLASPAASQVSDDDLPVIGGRSGADALYVAGGHGASGLLLGPAGGRVVADLSTGARRPSTSPTSRPPASPDPADRDLVRKR